jgi:hypothetical protein
MGVAIEAKMGSGRASRSTSHKERSTRRQKRVNGLASKGSKEGIVEVPGTGDTLYVQMNTLEALLDKF